MLLSNIGGRYLAIDIPQNIEVLFSKYMLLRLIVLFSIFFMATRDIKISLVLLLFFYIILKFFMNENSRFCIFPGAKFDNKKISEEEYKKAKEIIENYSKENKVA